MRLGCERLESRELPAHLFFFPSQADANGDYSALNLANLRIGPSQYAPTPINPVTPADDLHFSGAVSNADAYIPANTGTNPLPRWFAGVHLEGGYSGDLDFRCSAFVGVLDLTGGSISAILQNDPYQYAANGTGGQISVTGALNWTNGGINAGAGAALSAFLNLMPGADGNANPQGGTVKLGSLFTLIGGTVASQLTVSPGGYALAHNGGFVAGASNTLLLKSAPGAAIVVDGTNKTDSGPAIEVKKDGKGEVTCDRPPGNTEQAVVKIVAGGNPKQAIFGNSGSTKITNRTTLQIGDTEAKPQSGYIQFDEATAETVLEAGSRIKCVDEATVTINKGKFVVSTLMLNGVAVEEQPQAVIATAAVALNTGITTGLNLADGAVLTTSGTKFKTLKVEGEFNWIGDVQFAISRDTTDSDRVISTKDVNTSITKAKLSLRWANPDADLQNNGAEWEPVAIDMGSNSTVKALPPAANISRPVLPNNRDIEVTLGTGDKKVLAELKAK